MDQAIEYYSDMLDFKVRLQKQKRWHFCI
ncbi:hypothetical protein P4671_27075 [Priestia megaterium]|nr:hypothetical protein [Priestia megaterium]